VARPLFAGVPYEYSSVVGPGSLVFTAGACPLDEDGAVVAPGDHAAQAAVAVDNLLTVLAANGAGAEHLVRTTIYVTGSHDDLLRTWDVIAGRLAPHRPPSTLLGVAVLGYTGQVVEIDGIAAVPA
jgi:enamine deaminase RidA (YjgF/YER057c/UK114 family)